MITPTAATLYVDSSKFNKDAISHLGTDVDIRPYEAIFEDARALGASLEQTEGEGASKIPKKMWISTMASWALHFYLGGDKKVEEARSPVEVSKAVKNDTELAGMRACHVRDGAALTEYFAWLEEELTVKGSKLDEVQGADKLEEIRS